MRRETLQTGEYYHIYNRGVDKRDIFLNEKDYIKFISLLRELNNESKHEERKLIKNKRRNNPELSSKTLELSSGLLAKPIFTKIIAYCINKNHYHLLLKQKNENGIANFLHKIGTAYTNYFNKKYNRSGSLFQGTYKAAHIQSSGQLWRTSCYINGNPEIHKICQAEKWPWSSYLDYLNLRNGTLCSKNEVLRDFSNINEYKNLLYDTIKENQEIKEEKDEI